jgi:hypothetical protein
VGKAGCLQRLLEIAAMRAARCVDDIERPDSKEAGEIYAWLSFGGVHGERFSAYYHGAPFSRAAALSDLQERREIAVANGACEMLIAALDKQRLELWRSIR